jgi:hypothetical protein
MKKANLHTLILITILLSMASGVTAHEEPEVAEGAAVEQPKVRDWLADK